MKKYFIIILLVVTAVSLTGCTDFLNIQSASKDYHDMTMEEPDGRGDVTPSPGRHSYEEGTTAPISAEPEDEDSAFIRWEGDEVAETSEKHTKVMMGSDVTIKAIFAEDIVRRLRLENNISTAGELSGSGRYNMEEEVEISVEEENLGYRFSEWEVIEPDDGVDVDDRDARSTVLEMPGEDVRVQAKFEDVGYGKVSLTASDSDGKDELSGYGKYTTGEEVEITAEAASNWRFVSWINSDVAFDDDTASQTTFDMPDEDIEIEAEFAHNPHLELEAETGGEITSEGGRFAPDTRVEISANFHEGYSFEGWTVVDGDGSISAPSELETTFTMGKEDAKIKAEFKEGPNSD